MTGRESVLTVIIALVVAMAVVPIVAMSAVMTLGHGADPIPMAYWGVSLLAGTAVIAAIAVLAYRLLDDGEDDEAIEQLRVAYARGEIDDEEYEKRYERLREE